MSTEDVTKGEESEMELVTQNKELGETIIQIAIERDRHNRQEAVIDDVQEMIRRRWVIAEEIANLQKSDTKIAKQLKAIESGEFEIQENGRIKYRDAKLNN